MVRRSPAGEQVFADIDDRRRTGLTHLLATMTVDELRRGIESMPPDEYERAAYYERWLRSIETIMAEKGVLTPAEVDARVAELGG